MLYSKKKVRFLIFIMALMIIFGAILTIIMLFRTSFYDSKNVYVKIGKTNVEEIEEISLKGFYPGTKQEYVLNITSEVPGEYSLDFIFKEIEDKGLKNHIIVSIVYDNVTQYEGRLSDLFDERTQIRLGTSLDETLPIKVTVTYSMPREVGNEAQLTSTLFDIIINAEMQ